MKRRKLCPRGHVFFKSSDCPTCPECETARRPTDGFLSELAAPARRALEGAGLTTPAKLSTWSEARVLELHGMGPNALKTLRANLARHRLRFSKG
jgi:hypothetical protein